MTDHSPDHAERAAIDPAAIAAGLTKAQREAITSEGYALPSMGPFGYDSIVIGFEHGRSAKALHRLGLAQLPWSPQVLTPIGLAVRAALHDDTVRGEGENG